jgi:two-component system sensor histidine kinase UhpB
VQTRILGRIQFFTSPTGEYNRITMSAPDQLPAPRAHVAPDDAPPILTSDGSSPPGTGRALPMLWRVFAANAAVFALAFALLALAPVTLHASIRLDELVLLLVGLAVMLLVDLLLLRQALTPLTRLAQVMATVDLVRPGRRAVGYERSSTEVVALAEAFNQMLERLETERRESSGRVLAAQEAERLRIARELHDEVGQTLTAVALRAEHAATHAGEDRTQLDELAAIVQDSLEDVRRISRELRPEALDDLGLINALIALCSRVGEQSGIRVRRRLETLPVDLPPEVELAIYRIAQEALTNAMRHSNASRVDVSLEQENGEMVLRVKDDGQGLPEQVIEGGGLAGMRERAMLIGGELKLDSAADGGVEVRLRVGPNEDR